MQHRSTTITSKCIFFVVGALLSSALASGEDSSSTSSFFSILKSALQQFLAGAIAGCCEVMLTYPLDYVKTRTQIVGTAYQQRETASPKEGDKHDAKSDREKSSIEMITEIYQKEGIKGLYRGVDAPIMCAIPWRAVRYLTFEQFQVQLNVVFGSSISSFQKKLIACFFSGLVESVILTPFEVIKIEMVMDYYRLDPLYKNTFHCFKKVYRLDGLFRGLYKGFVVTSIRQILFSITFFISYGHIRDYLLEYMVKETFVIHLISGFLAGMLSSIVNTPVDSVKTKIQKSMSVRFSTLQVFLDVVKKKGFLTLYSGLVPRTIRAGVGNAIIQIIYEFLASL